MIVVVDDTHGLGVLGPTGRGTREHEGGVAVDIQIGNLGKALGSFGAYVACSERVRELLVNRARSFIFTCGLAPGPVGASRHGTDPLHTDVYPHPGGDVPAIVGSEDAVMQICEAGLRKGVYAQGIRHPSVPRGTARIRFTPMCTHTPEEIETTARVFAELAQRYPR
jgi:glycine C-acetyltransferase